MQRQGQKGQGKGILNVCNIVKLEETNVEMILPACVLRKATALSSIPAGFSRMQEAVTNQV